MTIVSLKTEAKGELSRIELSDGSLFSFRICYLPPEFFNLQISDTDIGREINPGEEAAFRHASACLRAEKAALRLIARAEQCTFGMARKLEKRGHETACIGAVISRLSEMNLLNDRRYAQFWLESRMRLSRTPRRLLSSICGRGIDHDVAQTALKTVLDEDTEFALLERFVKKYSRKAAKKEAAAFSLKYLLRSEGFSSQAINRFYDND